jgi:general secretion pathway protein G
MTDMNKFQQGFTLAELIVAISIIAILTSIVWVNFSESLAIARDTERQGDLRRIEAALELYKNDIGRYPDGCNGAGNWSGQPGSGSYECSGSQQYIIGLSPKYIEALPVDPRLNPNESDSGYVYTTDNEGMVYKIMALNTVETEEVRGFDTTSDPDFAPHPFARCGPADQPTAECYLTPGSPVTGCGSYTYNTCGNTLAACQTNDLNTYAVSGGYASGGDVSGNYQFSEQAREYFSDIIKCK